MHAVDLRLRVCRQSVESAASSGVTDRGERTFADDRDCIHELFAVCQVSKPSVRPVWAGRGSGSSTARADDGIADSIRMSIR